MQVDCGAEQEVINNMVMLFTCAFIMPDDSDRKHSRVVGCKKAPTKLTDQDIGSKAARFVRNGMMKKAVRLTTSGGVSAKKPPTMDGMRAKFPSDIGNDEWADVGGGVLAENGIQVRHIKSALLNFHATSAPGPDSVMPSAVRQVLNTNKVDDERVDLMGMVTHIFGVLSLQWQLPRCMKESRVIAIPKSDDDPDPTTELKFRPVQISGIMFRIFNLAMQYAVKESNDLSKVITEYQVGMEKEGLTLATNTVQAIYEHGDDRNRHAVSFELDIANAYNCMSRKHMLGCFKMCFDDQLASLLGDMLPTNGEEQVIWYGDERVMCDMPSGTRQGDPMGSPGFCIALSTLLRRIADEIHDEDRIVIDGEMVPKMIVYADNIEIFLASTDPIDRILDVCDEAKLHMGVELKPTHTRIALLHAKRYMDGEDQAYPIDEVRRIGTKHNIEIGFTQPTDDQCLVVMGVPVGNDEAVLEHLYMKADENLRTARQCALHLGIYPHELLAVLRYCFSTKMMHFARCLRSDLVHPVLLYYDIGLNELFLKSVGLPLSCMFDVNGNVADTVPDLDVFKNSLVDDSKLPDGLSINWRGLELMLSARYGGIDVSSCSTMAVAQRIGMFVNICGMKSSCIAKFFKKLIHPYLNESYRIVELPCNEFYVAPLDAKVNHDSNCVDMVNIPHFFEDVIVSANKLCLRTKVRSSNNEVMDVDDDIDWSKCTIEWLLPSDNNGARILLPNKASKCVSDVARSHIQKAVLKHSNIPKCGVLSLMESAYRGARDVLLSHPSWSSCLSPSCISILIRQKLVLDLGLASKCRRCTGKPGVRHLEHCECSCTRGYRTARHQYVVTALEKELNKHPKWNIMRNDRVVVDHDEARVRERVSDITLTGEYNAHFRSVQFDVSTVNVHCPSVCNVWRPYEVNTGSCNDPIKPVVNREWKKHNQYNNDWHPERPDDYFIPVCMSAYGAMSRRLIGDIRRIACEILDADDSNDGHGGWVVPHDHILVSLLAQRIRTNLAAAAVRSSCRSFSRLVGFA